MDWLEAACRDLRRATTRASSPRSTPRACSTAIRRYERIEPVAGRIMCFAGLRYYQNTTRRRAPSSSPTARPRHRLHDAAGLLDPGVQPARGRPPRRAARPEPSSRRYKPVFDRMRAMKPYQLSDELERFLHDPSVVGAAAWNRLFDETMAGLEFEVDGETLGARGDAEPPDRPGPRAARGRRRGAGRGLRREARRTSRASTTRSPRRRRSRTAGASCPRRRRAATSPTTSSPRWSRRCATPWSPPTRASRTATTG